MTKKPETVAERKNRWSSNKKFFEWTPIKECVAIHQAQGFTLKETANKCGCSERSVSKWKEYPEFLMEIDRLSLLVDIASRAERLRIAMRVVRQRTKQDEIITSRDLLDWLKFAQSETDGAELKLTTVFEALEAETRTREKLIGEGHIRELPEEISS